MFQFWGEGTNDKYCIANLQLSHIYWKVNICLIAKTRWSF